MRCQWRDFYCRNAYRTFPKRVALLLVYRRKAVKQRLVPLSDKTVRRKLRDVRVVHFLLLYATPTGRTGLYIVLHLSGLHAVKTLLVALLQLKIETNVTDRMSVKRRTTLYSVPILYG